MRRVVGIDCPKCEAKVKADVIATEVVDDPDGTPDYRVSLARCPGCHQALLSREECTGAENWGDNEFTFGAASRAWPEPDRKADKAVPPIVQVSLDEAHKCHRAGALTACAVMCGRALEGVCVHFGLKNMLAKALPELRSRGIIDERLFQWGEQLRKHRNAAAHPTEEKISRDDATDLLEFVEAICEYIFVLTARFEAFMARKNAGAPPASIAVSGGALPVAAAMPAKSDAP